jgi:ankyrin repeat protein/uncharacterized protein with HEPN domain
MCQTFIRKLNMSIFDLNTEVRKNYNRARNIQELYAVKNLIIQLKKLSKYKDINSSLWDDPEMLKEGRVVWNTYIDKGQKEQRKELIKDILIEITHSISTISWADGGIKQQHQDIPWNALEYLGTIAVPGHQHNWLYQISFEDIFRDIPFIIDSLERIYKRENFKFAFLADSTFQGKLVEQLFIVPSNKAIGKDKEYQAGQALPITDSLQKSILGLPETRRLTEFLQGIEYLEKINKSLAFICTLNPDSEQDRIAILGIIQEIGEYSKHLPSYIKAQLPALINLKALRDMLGHDILDTRNSVEILKVIINEKDIFIKLLNDLKVFHGLFTPIYGQYNVLYDNVKVSCAAGKADEAKKLIPSLGVMTKTGPSTLLQTLWSRIENFFTSDIADKYKEQIDTLKRIIFEEIPAPSTQDEYSLFRHNIYKLIVDPLMEEMSRHPEKRLSLGKFKEDIANALKKDFKATVTKNQTRSTLFHCLSDGIAREILASKTKSSLYQSRTVAQLECLEYAINNVISFSKSLLKPAHTLEAIQALISTDASILSAVKYLSTVIGENIRNLEQDPYFIIYSSGALRLELESLKWLRNNLMHGKDGTINPEAILNFFKHSVLHGAPLSHVNTVLYFTVYLQSIHTKIKEAADKIRDGLTKALPIDESAVLSAQKRHIDEQKKEELRTIFKKFGGYRQYMFGVEPNLTEADFNAVYFILTDNFKIVIPQMSYNLEDRDGRLQTIDNWNTLVSHVIKLLSIKDDVNWVTLQQTVERLNKAASDNGLKIIGIFGVLFGDGITEKLGIMVEQIHPKDIEKYTNFKREVHRIYGNEALPTTMQELIEAGHSNVQSYPIESALATREFAQSIFQLPRGEGITINKKELGRDISSGQILIDMPINYQYGEGHIGGMPKGTLLHMAVECGFNKLAIALIKIGADTNIQDEHGQTVLHYVCKEENLTLLKGILSAKDTKTDIQDKFGKTALHYAAESQSEIAINLLVQYKADPNIPDRAGHKAIEYVTNIRCFRALCRITDGLTPLKALFIAVQACDLGTVAKVLTSNPNIINEYNEEQETAFNVACGVGDIRLIALLKAKTADIFKLNGDGNNALHVYLNNNDPKPKFVKLLLSWGLNPNSLNNMAENSLHLSLLRNNHHKVSKILLHCGASPNVFDSKKITPLMSLVKINSFRQQKEDFDLLSAMLANGADPHLSSPTQLRGGGHTAYEECKIRGLDKAIELFDNHDLINSAFGRGSFTAKLLQKQRQIRIV